MNPPQIIGIYHKDCIDGTTSAAVLLKRFPDAKLYPLQHAYSAKELEPIVQLACPDAEIYTVDCGLGAKEFLAAGHHVTTIDHHRGSKQIFEKLAETESNYTFVFDDKKSGASLSWCYFFTGQPLPEVVILVEDQDLWKWEFGDDTAGVNYYLSMFLNQPEKVVNLLEKLPQEVKDSGFVLSRYANVLIERYTLNTKPNMAKIGAYSIPAYNIVDFQSQCGNILSEMNDSAVMLYAINGSAVRLSFRSQEHHRPTSSDLAEIVNGGGHQNAAGAHVTLGELSQMFEVT